MTDIASGLVRTNRTGWRRRFSAKCWPSAAPLAIEPHVRTQGRHREARNRPTARADNRSSTRDASRWRRMAYRPERAMRVAQ